MHFVVLGHMDPNDEAFWSGIPMNIVRSLKQAGHSVSTVGPLSPHATLWSRVKGRFYRHVLGKVYLPNRDPAVIKARAKMANRLLRAHGAADAVVVVYPPDAAYLRCDIPLILVHDATWERLLDFYPGYERGRLATETQIGGHELDQLVLANCDCAIYASQWAADSALRYYRTDPSKVKVSPLGAAVGSTVAHGDIDRWLEQRGRGPCRLLFVGVDWHRKGGDKAIAIARLLHEQGMPVELQIVGCAAPADAPAFVRSHGFLSQKDPEQAKLAARLFEQADFFLLPTQAECFGMVFCEAAAYGLPVITTNVAAIPEIIRNGAWGLTLPPAAPPQESADWIRAIFADRDAYRKMAHLARQDFEDRLDWEVFCRNLVATANEIQLARQGR